MSNINWNKHDLKIGDEVILDNRHTIKIIGFTKPSSMFATVISIDGGESWEVMTNRLKPKELKDGR